MNRPDPVFTEPWHAQAFALAVGLHEQGRFAWSEFADALASTVGSDPDGEYYASWLTALERVVVAHGLTSAEAIADREDAWHRAARATPHGAPITLPAGTPAAGTPDG